MYVIGAKHHIDNYLERANEKVGINDVVTSWATPIQNYSNPNEWAILKHPSVDTSMTKVDELDESWTPPQEGLE